jgi:hypothetical protein
MVEKSILIPLSAVYTGYAGQGRLDTCPFRSMLIPTDTPDSYGNLLSPVLVSNGVHLRLNTGLRRREDVVEDPAMPPARLVTSSDAAGVSNQQKIKVLT